MLPYEPFGPSPGNPTPENNYLQSLGCGPTVQIRQGYEDQPLFPSVAACSRGPGILQESQARARGQGLIKLGENLRSRP